MSDRCYNQQPMTPIELMECVKNKQKVRVKNRKETAFITGVDWQGATEIENLPEMFWHTIRIRVTLLEPIYKMRPVYRSGLIFDGPVGLVGFTRERDYEEITVGLWDIRHV